MRGDGERDAENEAAARWQLTENRSTLIPEIRGGCSPVTGGSSSADWVASCGWCAPSVLTLFTSAFISVN